jgi:hypothetical protein
VAREARELDHDDEEEGRFVPWAAGWADDAAAAEAAEAAEAVPDAAACPA